MCLTTCPAPFYTDSRDNSQGFRKYVCNKVTATSPLSVKIQNLGFQSRVQKNLQVYPKAEIYNSDTTKPISSIVWTQIDPTPTSETITIFFKDASNNLINTGAVVKLKMSAFNYMSESQSVKLRVDVTNSAGDLGVDIMEFFLNESPFSSNTIVTNLGGADNKESKVTVFTMYVKDWYDSIDDTQQQLEFRTYMVFNKRNYMLTPFSKTNIIVFKLPYLSNINGFKSDIALCVEAKDKHDATTSYCKDYTEVVSNYKGDLMALFKPYEDLDMSNSANMLSLAQTMNFVLTFMSFGEKATDYSHPSSEDYICAMDFH